MSSERSDEAVGRQVDPLYVVPSGPELERAIASVTGVATAEVHTSEDGRDRLRISLINGADPEVVAWAVAATLRERFGIALDPATIALRPSTDAPTAEVAPPAASHRPPPPPRLTPTSSDGFAGDPALVAAARAAMGTHLSWGSAVGVAEANGTGTEASTGGVETAGATGGAPAPDSRERPRPSPSRASTANVPGPSEQVDRSPASAREVAVAAARTEEGGGETAAPGSEPRTPRQVDPAPRDASPRRRAAITDLVARPDGDDLAVLATLRLADREATGRARGLGTRRGRWRAIAFATLSALGELTEGQLRAEVDQVTVLTFPDLAHVSVAVTVLGEHGEERFLGAAMVRDDPDRAVMRATLDAVNRRVEPWLTGGGHAGRTV